MHEDGFHLIIGGVPDCNPRRITLMCDICQEVVAGKSSCFFQRTTSCSKLALIKRPLRKLCSIRPTNLFYELRFAAAFGT